MRSPLPLSVRTLLGAPLLVAMLAGCGAGGGWNAVPDPRPAGAESPDPSPRTSAPRAAPSTRLPSGTPTARPAAFGRRVGALFAHDTDGDHYCTASAVDSPAGNLLITAAHCIHGGKGSDYAKDLLFVPAYRDGKKPYGVWRVKALLVDGRWAAHSDPDLDVGFVVLSPKGGRNVADVLGTNRLGIDEGFTNVVRVTGYPTSSDTPITCLNATTRKAKYQMRFACRGYFPGTSGSPWIAHYDPATGRGEIVGVIGGYQTGGKGADVSYSSYFDEDVLALYDRAVRASTAR